MVSSVLGEGVGNVQLSLTALLQIFHDGLNALHLLWGRWRGWTSLPPSLAPVECFGGAGASVVSEAGVNLRFYAHVVRSGAHGILHATEVFTDQRGAGILG